MSALNTPGKLLKVSLEFENEIKTLSGEEAQKWFEISNILILNAYARGHRPFESNKFHWEIVAKK